MQKRLKVCFFLRASWTGKIKHLFGQSANVFPWDRMDLPTAVISPHFTGAGYLDLRATVALKCG